MKISSETMEEEEEESQTYASNEHRHGLMWALGVDMER